MIKVALDIDDFNWINPRMDIWLKLKDYFPNFKVSMFTIPNPRKCDYGPYLTKKDTLEEIKKHLDWIQIIPHSFTHESSHEMESYSYESFKLLLSRIEEIFNKDGVPFVKGFKAAHWRWNEGVVKALDEAGWWGGVLREDKMIKTKKFYRYNYLLNEEFWKSKEDVLKLHGHVFGTKNDIGKCIDNLFKLPQDTQFHFITDFIETI